MAYKRVEISGEDISRQKQIMAGLCPLPGKNGTARAFVDTYGCQQNEADSEKLRGMLSEMGCEMTSDEKEADIVVINTCAVREHAEMRVFGNVGALSHTKRANPNQIICVCGCMAQEPGIAEKIKRSYPYVDIVFGPHMLWRFPEILQTYMQSGRRMFLTEDDPGAIAEGLPEKRDGTVKAWLSIMYGCNNFCSYCIVPYVRGRERSRRPEAVLEEARRLVSAGYRDITLLGQNVNSYGRDLESNISFAGLLRQINDIPGDFRIRFMTSHPKDASEELFRTMAECSKVSKHIHLPFQAGNNRVLEAMNRGYTAEEYLEKAELARRYMPDLVMTSDVIVGFPGETSEEFEDTLRLVEKVRFDALFTFIYSRRPGTPAAEMPDPASREEKQRNFERLVSLQNKISAEKHAAYTGRTLRVLIDSMGEEGPCGRTDGGRLVRVKGDVSPGDFADVEITGSNTWALYGKVISDKK